MFHTRLLFPLERPATSIISEYEVSVFRDVEAAVTAVPDIVCNSGLDIGDMVVEHNETEDEEERIAWFLNGGCLCKLLYCTLCSTQFITSLPQEARNECRQLTRDQLMVVMCQFWVSCSFVHFDIVSTQ